ncbi:serine hydrolase domain-containing protein [Jannaschia sp. LMIT008]|uniref:serine hydrolase domain-containing protein n=1 Tax=Jannaschia maritima TaxID=3032585 RepID=UPI002811E1D0|nr:serine hydrolase domain-containing protein [Jannaschia sp. LMIT008]
MADAFDDVRRILARALTQADPARALAVALARIEPDGSERAWLQGSDGPGGPPVGDAALRFRVASVTKMATARTVLDVLPPDAPVPAIPGASVSHLLSHTAGLSDEAGYVVEPPGDPFALIRKARTGTRPGAFFRYCNLGYVLAANMAEHVTGEGFDVLMRRHVLDPARIGGGPNWAGVPNRAARLALWQWDGDRYARQVDGPGGDWDADSIWRDGEGRSLASWKPGQAAWFSPQGGLRLNVIEMARLVRMVAVDDRMARPAWRFDGRNGMDGGGLFRAVGQGLTLYDGHPELPGLLVGHAGHALGFTGGAWHKPDGTCWAYAILGGPDLTDGMGDEVFYRGIEREVMVAIAR